MDSGQLNSLLKRLCKILWEAQVTNPITYVTQLSYLIFLKMLEEMDSEQKEVGNGKYKSLFGKFSTNSWGQTDFEPLRWSVLTNNPDNARMLATLRDTLPKLAEHPHLSQGARAVFQGAAVVIPDGATLRRLTDSLSPLALLSEDADIKGDLFEILANDLGGQKKAAQFRTPRHLIRVITQMVDPKIGQTICDPACGTGGFLIAAYEHILLSNTSSDFVREVESPYGGAVKRGAGDKLTRAQWDFLQARALHGFDGDADILRMAAMNAVLHGFDASPLVRRDAICGSEDRWDEVQFDVILENPPFSGARTDAKPRLRIEKGDKYVLFLAHALRSLRPGGRAGIIFPNGILFGDTGSHIEVKKQLLDNFDLQAVVTLPKGMFEPYTPNPTCFLIFENTGRPTESTWFYRLEGDGSSLTRSRKFGPQFRNDFPGLLAKWPHRVEEPGRAWRVPAQAIRNANCNLTLSALGLIEPEKTDHESPEEILEQIAEKQERALELIEEIRTLLLEDPSYDRSSWPTIPLSEAGEIVGGGTPSKANADFWEGDIPWVSPKEMKRWRIGESSLNISSKAVGASAARLIPSPAVLFVVRGMILAHTVPVAVSTRPLTINQDMKAIVPRKGLSALFLAYMMLGAHENLLSMIEVAGHGTRKLESERWGGLPIPLPSPEVQEKVVVLLEKMREKTDELLAIRKESDRAFGRLMPSILAKAFQGGL